MSPLKGMDHFRSLPNNWIASLLKTPDYTPIPTDSRTPKPSGEDTYFASVLATQTTIPHLLTLRRRELVPPPPPSPEKTSVWPAPTAKPTAPPAVSPPDVIVLVDLRAPGICGHPETVHGGVIATLLDEAMSLAVSVQAGTVNSSDPSSNPQEQNPRGKIYTAQLDVRYKRPLLVPSVAIVRARVVAREGRKFWVRAQIVQEEEDKSQGQLEWPKRKVVTTDAMAFWLQIRDSHL